MLSEAALRRQRATTYTNPPQSPTASRTLRPLRKTWATLNGISGKRLAPFLPETAEVMERTGELLSVLKSIGRSAYALMCKSERAPHHAMASPPLGRTWSFRRQLGPLMETTSQ